MAARVRVASIVLAIGIASAATVACASLLGLDEKQLAANNGCGPDEGGYHDMKNRACWSTHYAPASFPNKPPYVGGAFDGRYTYFVSNLNGRVVRYDTSSPFDDDGAWSSYNTTNLQGGYFLGYAGVVFDGRYVYIVSASLPTVFIRYDTTKDFGHEASWENSAAGNVEVEYQGGTFDGRYLYFAPYGDLAGSSGSVARYDTRGPFGKAASWAHFDTTKMPPPLGPVAGAYFGAAFDGRYVYFVPSGFEANVVARYDTRADSFAADASWTLFSTKQVDKAANGYHGATFDGRYITLVPFFVGSSALEYDVAQPFTDVASWRAHVPAPDEPNVGLGKPVFGAGAFDGRYTYYVPGLVPGNVLNGVLARHDGADAGGFDAGWSIYDTRMGLKAGSFGAAVFDGRYLYLPPASNGPFVRFDAKDVPSQPDLRGYFGSFF